MRLEDVEAAVSRAHLGGISDDTDARGDEDEVVHFVPLKVADKVSDICERVHALGKISYDFSWQVDEANSIMALREHLYPLQLASDQARTHDARRVPNLQGLRVGNLVGGSNVGRIGRHLRCSVC